MRNFCTSFIAHNVYSSEKANICLFKSDSTFFIVNGRLIVTDDSCRLKCLNEDLPDITQAYPLSLDFCVETNLIIVVFSNGSLITVDAEIGAKTLVGEIENGVESSCWSPGEDLLALITRHLSVVILNQDLEPFAETDLFGTEEEKQVSVGWGKKETQFRGSEGKIKSEPQKPVSVTIHDDGKVRISWRGDGEMFAVSLKYEERRFIKVLSRDGLLLHTSEQVVGLESPLSWRPSGNLLVSSQRLPNKYLICFFEKNTLPHGNFQIPSNAIVKELLWNCDSNVLASVMELDGTEIIQLFTTSNYHWYHKGSVKIDGDLVQVAWDQTDSTLLHVVTWRSQILRHSRYTFCWNLTTSSCASKEDQAIVAVVDGNRLLTTHFSQAIIPPPMSSAVIDSSVPVVAAGFLQFGAEDAFLGSNDFFIQLLDNRLLFYRLNSSKKAHDFHGEILLDGREMFALSWVSSKTLLACIASDDGTYLLRVICLEISGEGVTLSAAHDKSLDEPLVAMRRIPESADVLCVTNSYSFKTTDLSQFNVVQSLHSFPKKVKGMLAFEVRKRQDGTIVTIILDHAQCLYINDTLFMGGVMSIRLHGDVLLMTTSQHKLLSWSINDQASKEVAIERPIERGARIVITVPDTSKVILQLPRGNLELVQPRALSLAMLRQDFAAKKFADAYRVMRRERINLNLLHDDNPAFFSSNIDHFLNEIQDPTLLYTFITDLSAENVAQSTYASYYEKFQKDFEQLPDKVARVCTLMLDAIGKRSDCQKLLLPELSCLIKQGKVEDALLRLKAVRDGEAAGSIYSVSSVEGLRHIMYYIDIEQLFKHALGTYDLQLVKFIASKSQKDPKEYIPFLSTLHDMDVNYQKFTIDKFLKRHAKALTHLVKCETRLNECVQFIEANKLHKEGLRLFPRGSTGYRAVSASYGRLLTQQQRDNEAGIMFLRSGEFNQAFYSFNRAGNWRQVIYCAIQLKYSPEKLKELYTSLGNSLIDDRRFEEAAHMFIEYSRDIPSGVTSYCAGGLFEEACRIAHLHEQEDLIISKVKPDAILTAETTLQNIKRLQATFEQQSNRLYTVRKKRLESDVTIDWDDSLSESSRGSSRSSTSTTRSAKNSRKLERKLLSLKEGSPFEDVALVASLYDLATQVAALKAQVRTINYTLLLLDEETLASSLQDSLKDCLSLILKAIPKVWNETGLPETNVGCDATSNSIAAAFTARGRHMPPAVRDLQPKIIAPPNMQINVEWEISLLGR